MAFSVDLESLFDVEWEWALSHCTTIQLTEIRQFEVDTPDFFSFNGMGLLLALFWHNNTGHVSLEPETTSRVSGLSLVVFSLRFWHGMLFTPFSAMPTYLGFKLVDVDVEVIPADLHLMLIIMQPIDLIPFRLCDHPWHIQNLAKWPYTCNKKSIERNWHLAKENDVIGFVITSAFR